MGETIDKEKGNLGTTLTDEVQSDSDKSKRIACVEIVDGKVNVATLRVSMSRKLRLLLASDVFVCSWILALTVMISFYPDVFPYRWYVRAGGFLLWLFSFGKTIIDFLEWFYTMQTFADKMGEWTASDVAALCIDILNGRAKFVAEEDKKAVDEESETETKDAEGEAQNP